MTCLLSGVAPSLNQSTLLIGSKPLHDAASRPASLKLSVSSDMVISSKLPPDVDSIIPAFHRHNYLRERIILA